MIRLVEAMPEPVRRTVLVREQYGFALNRAGRSEEAEKVLLGVVDDHGPSSETLGLLGRVYKDRWEAEREGSVLRAEGHLEQAIDAYRRGFEADWRDAYPGVNAVTLMEIRDPGGPAQQELAARRPLREPPACRRRRRRLLGPRDAARARGRRARPRGGDGRRARGAGGGARALGAREHRLQPLADPRGACRTRDETVDWADELEHELLKAAGKDRGSARKE